MRNGSLFVARQSKRCTNPACGQSGKFYHAGGVLRYSLPHSTYGLDVLAYIGWQHEQEQRQLSEIQRELNGRGILVNERNVGKLYRQFLALLGGGQCEDASGAAGDGGEAGRTDVGGRCVAARRARDVVVCPV